MLTPITSINETVSSVPGKLRQFTIKNDEIAYIDLDKIIAVMIFTGILLKEPSDDKPLDWQSNILWACSQHLGI